MNEHGKDVVESGVYSRRNIQYSKYIVKCSLYVLNMIVNNIMYLPTENLVF